MSLRSRIEALEELVQLAQATGGRAVAAAESVIVTSNLAPVPVIAVAQPGTPVVSQAVTPTLSGKFLVRGHISTGPNADGAARTLSASISPNAGPAVLTSAAITALAGDALTVEITTVIGPFPTGVPVTVNLTGVASSATAFTVPVIGAQLEIQEIP
jgi:hypothetical protein